MSTELKSIATKFENLHENNLLELTSELVLYVESLQTNGAKKKELVLEALSVAIEQLPFGGHRQKLRNMLRDFVPQAIDLSIAIANSSLFGKCSKSLFSCCK